MSALYLREGRCPMEWPAFVGNSNAVTNTLTLLQ